MLPFTYKNPTKIIFGKESVLKLPEEINKDYKILLLYGGGSIKHNGIYNQVTTALQGYNIIEFGGVPANPEYEVLIQALCVIKEKQIDFVLAVGGGSVIDAAKFLVAAAKYQGDEPWNMLTERYRPTEALPFGAVLTLPATGSEMNSGLVISRKATNEKLSMGGTALFPQFSILDPTVTHSIPKRQLVNGVVDAFNHVLEQYVTYPVGASLQDRFAESVLQTLLEEGPKVIKNPKDEVAASNFMWSCTLALNGLLSQGVPTDWAVHTMGHELTALFNIDHARTLAIVGPRHYEYFLSSKKEKLAQLGKRVFNIQNNDVEATAKATIVALEEFYHSLNVATKLSDYTTNYKDSATVISSRFTARGWKGIGEKGNVTPTDIEKIITMCF